MNTNNNKRYTQGGNMLNRHPAKFENGGKVGTWWEFLESLEFNFSLAFSSFFYFPKKYFPIILDVLQKSEDKR